MNELQILPAPVSTINHLPTRDETILRIRRALRQRTGKSWSVTGGRGTAWGWIKIDAMPMDKLAVYKLKAGHQDNSTEDWEEVVSPDNQGKGHMTPSDREVLAEALGLESVHFQGVSIAASSAHYLEYIDRAEGRTPSVKGEQYWD